MNRLHLVGGMAIGAGIVYFFDGSQGRRRRSRLAHGLVTLTDSVSGSMRSRRITRAARAKSRSWEVPMATVNIDIDQGTVTLRGAFPPSDAPRAGRRPHRGITRARDHAEARPRFSGPAEG